MPSFHPQGVAPQRRNLDDNHDPYIPDGHYPEGTRCSECGAVYHNQHWSLDPAIVARVAPAQNGSTVVCPGCRKVDSRDPGGVLRLSGGFWQAHRDEILNLIQNEEKRALATNPLERIMEIATEGEELIVWTTNEKLVQRLGRALHKAYNGTVEYKWSEDNKLARVTWSREG
jgi:hypothetical protein